MHRIALRDAPTRLDRRRLSHSDHWPKQYDCNTECFLAKYDIEFGFLTLYGENYPVIDTLSRKLTSLRLLVLLPLIVLAIDLFQAPFFLSTTSSGVIPKIEKLLPREIIYLGRFRGHKITVSVGTLGESGNLNRLADSNNGRFGLVMSHFIVRKDFISNTGPVGRTVHSLLRSSVSDEVADSFLTTLRATVEHRPGDVVSFRVGGKGKKEQVQFPIDVIYIVLLNARDPKTKYIANIKAGLVKTMEMASAEASAGLLVTTLGLGPSYRPADPADFYGVLLDSVRLAVTPENINVQFYANWPTEYMIENIDDLNTTWINATSVHVSSRLYRAEFRFAFACLAICLLVSSLFVPLTIKNAFLVSVAYLGSVLAAGKILTFLLSGYGPDFLFFGSLAFQAILAFFFPYIVRLNPRKVFSENSRS